MNHFYNASMLNDLDPSQRVTAAGATPTCVEPSPAQHPHAMKLLRAHQRGAARSHRAARSPLAFTLAAFATMAGCSRFEEVATDVSPGARPAMDEAGTVAAIRGNHVIVDGDAYEELDVAPYDLRLDLATFAQTGVRVNGDQVFLTATSLVPWWENELHVWDRSNGTLDKIYGSDFVRPDIAVSRSGIVAFTDISSRAGALYRRLPGSSVEAVLHSQGPLVDAAHVDVNDSGAVLSLVENTDSTPFDPRSRSRAVLYLESPVSSSIDDRWYDFKSPLHGLDVDDSPHIALNNADEIILGIPQDTSYKQWTLPDLDDYEETDLPAGIYQGTAKALSEEIELQPIAQKGTDFCRFGQVDVTDHGMVYFEALLTGSDQCDATEVTAYSGIFRGPSADDAIVRADETDNVDGVLMGQMNNKGQVAFLAVRSEAGQPKYSVVRYTPPKVTSEH